jgi:hypothetical protein
MLQKLQGKCQKIIQPLLKNSVLPLFKERKTSYFFFYKLHSCLRKLYSI